MPVDRYEVLSEGHAAGYPLDVAYRGMEYQHSGGDMQWSGSRLAAQWSRPGTVLGFKSVAWRQLYGSINHGCLSNNPVRWSFATARTLDFKIQF